MARPATPPFSAEASTIQWVMEAAAGELQVDCPICLDCSARLRQQLTQQVGWKGG